MEDNWVRRQFAADGKKCLHCPKSLSGSNVTRLKQHLLNSKACVGFFRSTAAAALASSDQEVRSDDGFIKMLIASNMSFAVVENPAVVAFFKAVRPSSA